MFGHVVDFYNSNGQVWGLGQVLSAQLRFVAGFVVAIVAALLFGGITSLIMPGSADGRSSARQRRWRNFWWSYMRISGVMILPLVFGHLAMQHLIQGVFDITARRTHRRRDGHHQPERARRSSSWRIAGRCCSRASPSGASTTWRCWRWRRFTASTALRYVLTDYTMKSSLAAALGDLPVRDRGGHSAGARRPGAAEHDRQDAITSRSKQPRILYQ